MSAELTEMPKLYTYVCPYCGRQYRGPGGHSVAGDNRATSCFHRHPGERGVVQPRLVRIEVAPVEPLVLLPIPHDSPESGGGGERLLTSKRTGPPATSPASPAPFRRRYATEREQRRDEILQRAEAARRRYCQRQGHTRVALLGFEPYCLRCRVSRPDLPR